MHHSFHNNIKQLFFVTVFNIDNIKKCFQSSKFSFATTGINYILKYIKIGKRYFKL